MVVGTIFKIREKQFVENEIKAVVHVDGTHAIFNGHFPGQPVLPGVCMLQLMKELVEYRDHQKYNIREADNLKFLSVVDPNVVSLLQVSIQTVEQNSWLVINASLFADNVTFFKLRAILTRAKA